MYVVLLTMRSSVHVFQHQADFRQRQAFGSVHKAYTSSRLGARVMRTQNGRSTLPARSSVGTEAGRLTSRHYLITSTQDHSCARQFSAIVYSQFTYYTQRFQRLFFFSIDWKPSVCVLQKALLTG